MPPLSYDTKIKPRSIIVNNPLTRIGYSLYLFSYNQIYNFWEYDCFEVYQLKQRRCYKIPLASTIGNNVSKVHVNNNRS